MDITGQIAIHEAIGDAVGDWIGFAYIPSMTWLCGPYCLGWADG